MTVTIDGATLEQLATYGAGGYGLAQAYYMNAQAMKRAGLLPGRWMPVVNLIAALCFVTTWFLLRPAFHMISGMLIVSSLFTYAHGGAKQVAAPIGESFAHSD